MNVLLIIGLVIAAVALYLLLQIKRYLGAILATMQQHSYILDEHTRWLNSIHTRVDSIETRVRG